LVSILGCAILLFVGGAAVMHFGLPTSNALRSAFTGGQAWQERERARRGVSPTTSKASQVIKEKGEIIDKPDKTFDGFTLFTTSHNCEARLIDMAGNLVHRWEMPFSKAWPGRAPHLPRPFPDVRIHWFRCHLFANGDLLAIYHALGDTPYGYGLVKMDKDSKLLWTYAGFVHHDLDVGEDGRIYTLTQKLVHETPQGFDFVVPPYIADELVILSAEGKELEKIPLVDFFSNSPYLLTLATVKSDKSPDSADPAAAKLRGDFFHTNSVKVLRRAMASKFPQFKAGQVLTSLRNRDTVAVLDLEKRSVVWAAQGVWRLQHDPEFLDNGHLLLFDNFGSTKGSRVLEYDPVTQAMPWSYTNEISTAFHATMRGTKQRLPNGNTLIVDPDSLRLLEVTNEKELVWQYYCHAVEWDKQPTLEKITITGAQRYGSDELTFLKGGQRARP